MKSRTQSFCEASDAYSGFRANTLLQLQNRVHLDNCSELTGWSSSEENDGFYTSFPNDSQEKELRISYGESQNSCSQNFLNKIHPIKLKKRSESVQIHHVHTNILRELSNNLKIPKNQRDSLQIRRERQRFHQFSPICFQGNYQDSQECENNITHKDQIDIGDKQKLLNQFLSAPQPPLAHRKPNFRTKLVLNCQQTCFSQNSNTQSCRQRIKSLYLPRNSEYRSIEQPLQVKKKLIQEDLNIIQSNQAEVNKMRPLNLSNNQINQNALSEEHTLTNKNVNSIVSTTLHSLYNPLLGKQNKITPSNLSDRNKKKNEELANLRDVASYASVSKASNRGESVQRNQFAKQKDRFQEFGVENGIACMQRETSESLQTLHRIQSLIQKERRNSKENIIPKQEILNNYGQNQTKRTHPKSKSRPKVIALPNKTLSFQLNECHKNASQNLLVFQSKFQIFYKAKQMHSTSSAQQKILQEQKQRDSVHFGVAARNHHERNSLLRMLLNTKNSGQTISPQLNNLKQPDPLYIPPIKQIIPDNYRTFLEQL